MREGIYVFEKIDEILRTKGLQLYDFGGGLTVAPMPSQDGSYLTSRVFAVHPLDVRKTPFKWATIEVPGLVSAITPKIAYEIAERFEKLATVIEKEGDKFPAPITYAEWMRAGQEVHLNPGA